MKAQQISELAAQKNMQNHNTKITNTVSADFVNKDENDLNASATNRAISVNAQSGVIKMNFG